MSLSLSSGLMLVALNLRDALEWANHNHWANIFSLFKLSFFIVDRLNDLQPTSLTLVFFYNIRRSARYKMPTIYIVLRHRQNHSKLIIYYVRPLISLQYLANGIPLNLVLMVYTDNVWANLINFGNSSV